MLCICASTSKRLPRVHFGPSVHFVRITLGCVFAVVARYLTRLYPLRWREAITFAYLPSWREVQEDTSRFARIVALPGKP